MWEWYVLYIDIHRIYYIHLIVTHIYSIYFWFTNSRYWCKECTYTTDIPISSEAAASGILLTALSAAGLEVSNCAAECTDTERSDALVNCREECEIQNFESQDPAVKTCIQFFYFAVIPSCQLIAVFLTWIFPIHSHRLELIYQNQEELYKPTQPASPTSPTAPASPHPDAEATAAEAPEIVAEALPEKPSSKTEL